MTAQRARFRRVPAQVRTLLLTLTVVAAGSGLAVAQDDVDAVSDGNDSRSRADIAAARATHDRANDRLAHVVRFHEASARAPSATRSPSTGRQGACA